MPPFLKRYLLPATVFITGACVLVIEIVAVRVLSPYFGNTIFSYSSVISVILAALSGGYYLGGRWADKRPTYTWFFGLILASSVALLVLHLIGLAFLPFISVHLPLTTGPLITSAGLFLLPAFLLGTLSPYAIKLQSMEQVGQGLGSISGTMFFWSTMGSIFGSLFAGFYLIPHIGVNKIFLSTGIVLLLLGAMPLLALGWRKKTVVAAVLVALLFGNGISTADHLAQGASLLERDGVYERIRVYDGWSDGRPARFLKQDRSRSAAMFLDTTDPADMVFDYTRLYSVYKDFGIDMRRALVIGAGGYTVPKALLADVPNIKVDAVDIEPDLEAVARQYFALPDDERLQSYTEDGRRFLHDADEPYDYIFSDVYHSLYSIPSHFTTREFFLLAKSRLSENGLFVANIIGDLSRRQPSLMFSEMKTFQSVFEHSYFLATESQATTERQNIMFIGYNGKQPPAFDHPDRIDLTRFELSPYITLTDDYAPVEMLTAQLLAAGEYELDVDGDAILSVIDQQLRYGPRFLGSQGHERLLAFLLAEMAAHIDTARAQTWSHEASDGQTHEMMNVIARLNPDNKRRIIVGTHYDSKKFADLDPKDDEQPVPGANDSASGVAVLIELAKVLAQSHVVPPVGVDFVFFDAEEGDGSIKSDYSDWQPIGSTYFADRLKDVYGETMPEAALIVDMVCDKDLRIKKEATSYEAAPDLVDAFWSVATNLHPQAFASTIGPSVRDDHTPLNAAGIPSMVLIDYEYPPFHTSEDTLDKCSAESLQTVAEALHAFIFSIQDRF